MESPRRRPEPVRRGRPAGQGPGRPQRVPLGTGRPSPRPSPAVYRRRRMTVMAAVILVIAAVLYAANQGGSGKSARRSAGGRRLGHASAVPPHLVISLANWQLPAPLSRAVALPVDGNIDVLGGLTGTGSTTTPAVTQYDPATGNAEAIGNLPVPVHDAAGAEIGAR